MRAHEIGFSHASGSQLQLPPHARDSSTDTSEVILYESSDDNEQRDRQHANLSLRRARAATDVAPTMNAIRIPDTSLISVSIVGAIESLIRARCEAHWSSLDDDSDEMSFHETSDGHFRTAMGIAECD